MTTRDIFYANELANSAEFLAEEKQKMVDLSILAQAILGVNPLVTGFNCTPNSPAALNVLVGPGTVFLNTVIDATQFGTNPNIAADSNTVTKYAYRFGNFTTPTITPPTTPGNSRNDLIQITLVEADGNPQLVYFFTGVNPSTGLPNPPSSSTLNTQRIDTATITIVTGVEAPTGSQTTPSPTDANHVGLWVVTTTQGQTTITSGNINPYLTPNPNQITETLTQKISQTTADSRYAKLQQVQYYAGIMNGGMTIAQREDDDLTLNTNIYGRVDTFYVRATGTAVSAGNITQGSAQSFSYTGYTTHLAGATVTGTGVVIFGHRIESNDSVNYINQMGSISLVVYHTVGSSVNYTINISKATAKNNFTSVTSIQTSSAIPVASATATLISLTGINLGDVTNGIQIEVSAACGAITTQDFHWCNFILNTGSIAIPFVPQDETATRWSCRRRYQKSYLDGVAVPTNTQSGLEAFTGNFVGAEDSGTSIRFQPEMVITPSFIPYSIAGTAGKFTTGGGPEMSFTTLTISSSSWVGFNAGTSATQSCGFYHFEAIADL